MESAVTSVELFCDRLHERARSAPILHRFAWFNRIMLFSAFFPTGLIKAFGLSFVGPKVPEPLYSFFMMLYSAGVWWRFIGASQVIAAILLLIPGLQTLGAILFLPILLNIVMINFSLDFAETAYLTSAMLLANLYLICWDYHRWKSLMPWWTGRAGAAGPECSPALAEKVLMVLSVASGILMFDRLHYSNHWISNWLAHESETVFILSTMGMLIAFVYYSVRTKRTDGEESPRPRSVEAAR